MTLEALLVLFAKYMPDDGDPNWYRWCQAAVTRALKFLFGSAIDYPTAYAAYWDDGTTRFSTNIADAQPGDILWWEDDEDWHVGIMFSGGRIFMAWKNLDVYAGGISSNVGWITFEHFQQRAGMKFRGVSKTNGSNKAFVAKELVVSTTTRIAGADGVRTRPRPYVEGEALNWYPQGTPVDCDGWINGQVVDGNGVWFRVRGTTTYVWSTNVGGPTKTGLTDLNPVPVADNTKKVVAVGDGSPLNVRSNTNTSANIVRTIPEGGTLVVSGFVTNGELALKTKVWFRLADGWVNGGGLTSAATEGLTDLTVTTPTKPVYVGKTPDIQPLTVADFAVAPWIKVDSVADPDASKTVNKDAWTYYLTKGQDYEFYPVEHGGHWWGDPKAGYTHDGVVKQFVNTPDLSVGSVLSAKRVTLMTPLDRVAYTTGPRSMYQTTAEVDPTLTDDVYLTYGAYIYLLEKKNPRLHGAPIRLHKEFMATSCSELNVGRVRAIAEQFVNGQRDIKTGLLVPVVLVPKWAEELAVSIEAHAKSEADALRAGFSTAA